MENSNNDWWSDSDSYITMDKRTIIDYTFVGGSSILKLRLDENNILWGASPRTGLNNYLPYTIVKKGISEARKRKINEEDIKKAEKELLEEEEYLKNTDRKTIEREIKKELARGGFRLILKKENVFNNNHT